MPVTHTDDRHQKEKERENTRPLSTTTYNRRIEIFVGVVRTYVRVCHRHQKEREREYETTIYYNI